jgi:hypothetical protein
MAEHRLAKRSQEDRQWKMSGVQCPACSLTMKLVGKERYDRDSNGYLLTFQCDCGQVFATRTDQ